jgi:transposase
VLRVSAGHDPTSHTQPRSLRYEFAEDEWIAIRPWLSTKPHGVPRVDKRRILSTASSGYCIRAHRGAIWRGASVHTHRRSLAKGRNLRQDHGCADHRSHCRRADNRNVHCLGASARGLYCRQQSGRRRIGVQTMIGSEQASVFGDREIFGDWRRKIRRR